MVVKTLLAHDSACVFIVPKTSCFLLHLNSRNLWRKFLIQQFVLNSQFVLWTIEPCFSPYPRLYCILAFNIVVCIFSFVTGLHCNAEKPTHRADFIQSWFCQRHVLETSLNMAILLRDHQCKNKGVKKGCCGFLFFAVRNATVINLVASVAVHTTKGHCHFVKPIVYYSQSTLVHN